MTGLSSIHKKLDSVLPLPDACPKIYLLGDTGAGKSTVLQHVLGTKNDAFPSTLKRRTTVAITEYVIDKNLDFKACFLLKAAEEVKASIEEIIEYSQLQLIKLMKSSKAVDIQEVMDNLGESPDQRFRLKYLLDENQLQEYATKLIQYCKAQMNDLAEDEGATPTWPVIDEIYELVAAKLEANTGKQLQSEAFAFLQEYENKNECLNAAKLFLKSGKESLSPLVSYARIQGPFGAGWLEANARFVIVDGEGIGHDIKESAILSSRHIDYFEFCDAIVLAEGAGKPFAAGGKSAVMGVIQNGYVERFKLLVTKLDELVDEDDEDSTSFENRIQDVKRSFKNLDQALESEGVFDERWKENVFFVENLKNKTILPRSSQQLNTLFEQVAHAYLNERARAKRPEYDFEMLSAYLEKSSIAFHNEWARILNTTPWQSIKAFNLRMVWKQDEYKYIKPVAQLHGVILKELREFILHPQSWPTNVNDKEKEESLDKILQGFATNVLAIERKRILDLVEPMWQEGMTFSGAGSTPKRARLVAATLDESVPHYNQAAAISFKDEIKQALVSALEDEPDD
jgi:hypothetical protein